MIPKKEFYFVRHGQTDHNLIEGTNKGDHPDDIPLNETGRNQAKAIEPIISTLPLQSICSSFMRRTQETREIISEKLQATHYDIEHLGECSAKIWKEFRKAGMYSVPGGEATLFLERVRTGLIQALSLPGPLLIVSHGGVHWATCCLLGIKDHSWSIDNCGLVHFSLDADGNWIAKSAT